MRLDQTFQITNPNSSPLTIALFNYVRWSPSGNLATNITATGDANSISVTDGTYLDTHLPTGTSAYQAGPATASAPLLTDNSVNDFNNTGLPYSGNNFADGFEWIITIPPNSSQSVEASLVVTHAVPEPSSLSLLGFTVARWSCRFGNAVGYPPPPELSGPPAAPGRPES